MSKSILGNYLSQIQIQKKKEKKIRKISDLKISIYDIIVWFRKIITILRHLEGNWINKSSKVQNISECQLQHHFQMVTEIQSVLLNQGLK